MKVLFANPPTLLHKSNFNRPIRFPTYNYATPVMHPPLLLAYAAAYARSLDHEVSFVDGPLEGLDLNDFLEFAKKESPEVVVFETSTPSFNNEVKVAENLKKAVKCKVIFVGPHVSAVPEQALTHDAIDVVVIGEYEISLGEYLSNGAHGVKGIGYRNKNGEIVISEKRGYIEDLDILPLPARDLLRNYAYFDPILKNPFTFVLAGRGCPYQCIFCNWPQVLSGRSYRTRSIENIIYELGEISNKYNFKSVLFNDDTFSINREHTMSLCKAMLTNGIGIPWACYLRADNTDEELLKNMRNAGCFLLKVGVESGSQDILNQSKKGYKLHKVREGVKLMKSLGFHVHATFVLGLPGETKETIRKTVKFAKELEPTTVQFSTAVPYPGTEFYKYLKEEQYFITGNYDEFMPLKKIYEYPKLSARSLTEAVRMAYRSYYLRPRYLGIGFKQLVSQPKVFFGNFKKLLSLIFKLGNND